MTTRGHGRKFGEKQSYPFPVWSGLLEHRDRIKTAIWTYLWLLDKITTEKDGLGVVNYGKRVRVGDIATDLSSDEKTIRIHLEVLVKGGYIKLRPARYGRVIEVCNSSKFGIWFPHWRAGKTPDLRAGNLPDLDSQTGRNARPDRKKCPTSTQENATEAVERTVVTESENAPTQHSYAATDSLSERDELFQRFWENYPKKRAKKTAERAWKKIKLSQVPAILAAVERWKKTEEWKREGGRFIPYPATFLNGERWEDMPEESQPQETEQGQEREMVKL